VRTPLKFLCVLSGVLFANAVFADCKPVYLTFDTGHMGVADFVAGVLKRHDVKVTFFVANEKTLTGGGSLDDTWMPWWKARVQEGHLIGSHTWDHSYYRGDLADGRLRIQPTAGLLNGQTLQWDARQYCEAIRQPLQTLAQAGVASVPLFRAPGGKTSVRSLQMIQRCGYAHVGWSPAGFLGDELPSETHSNRLLLDKALRDIRKGDVLLAHLGIWSRKQAWAPEVLEPLITGLKARGFCFRTLDAHPLYQAHLRKNKAP
jgi:peptidoglycan-N-acetylmuramic acid deacetylase